MTRTRTVLPAVVRRFDRAAALLEWLAARVRRHPAARRRLYAAAASCREFVHRGR